MSNFSWNMYLYVESIQGNANFYREANLNFVPTENLSVRLCECCNPLSINLVEYDFVKNSWIVWFSDADVSCLRDAPIENDIQHWIGAGWKLDSFRKFPKK